ncbi:hypothetical protein EYR40_003383 [Pleurotus pulmonarius]|nr:hypothetical protein EYR40_003383 [Pleurotus pulmonarius]
MHLMYTLDENGNRVYTLKKVTDAGHITKSAHPARFSPDDKFSRHRVTLKKRYGVLLTQLPAKPIEPSRYKESRLAQRLTKNSDSRYSISIMAFPALIVLATCFVSQVLAHGGVVSYTIGGQTFTGWQPYNDPSSQSSIERPYSESTTSPPIILSATAATISCNNNGQASAHQLTTSVPAGTEIIAHWSQWTHAQGPVMVYMAKCPGACTAANSATLDWFKIAETGLISGTLPSGVWGTGQVMDTLSYTTSIPAALAPGEYLIRHELLALHQANTPQFYPECAQLTITGSGTKTPSGSYLVKFPGGYSASDPSIDINIYTTEAASTTTYKVPGPPVWNGQ